MSIQRERANSSRSKQVLVKVNHISKRLPEDFFLPKAMSSSPKKRESDLNPKQVLNWYERDDSCEKNSNKIRSRLIRRNDPVKHSRLMQPIQPQQISNQNQMHFNRLLQISNQKQSIILHAIREAKKQPKIKIVPRLLSHSEKERQSSQRIVKSQYKRHRRLQSPITPRASIIISARMSLREIKRQSPPSRYQNMNVGFDGYLTFNRFS